MKRNDALFQVVFAICSGSVAGCASSAGKLL